ncbi:MAG: DNA/RNA non-specific endonuclease [Prevotella sp.]|nr:DNA/RNA non-specific endonuclease [Prevotella sp.]
MHGRGRAHCGANEQTFCLTNMQPQWQAHNGGLWNNLETKASSFYAPQLLQPTTSILQHEKHYMARQNRHDDPAKRP